MNWEVKKSRSGALTIKVNGIYLYSKYSPKQDAEKFIEAELDYVMDSYLLIGLGLGYHIQALLEKTTYQQIYIFPIDHNEINVYKTYGDSGLLKEDRVELINLEQIPDIIAMDSVQIIIPFQWIRALEDSHPLHDYLLDIKTKQMSYKSSTKLFRENFNNNIQNNDQTITSWHQHSVGQAACLVSAGPSLNEAVSLLKKIQEKVFIISVGSALKVLLKHSVMPSAVIITDPSKLVAEQIEQTSYDGPLFYLSTANFSITQIHKYNRYIIFQEGYSDAESYALSIDAPLLKTGGSVATTALSLLEYMGFQNVFLVGQDLGFSKERTHATGSTSGVSVVKKYNFREIVANSGNTIYTTSSLLSFKKWFERKAENTVMNIYNTAWNGVKIEGVPFIIQEDVLKIVNLSDSNSIN